MYDIMHISYAALCAVHLMISNHNRLSLPGATIITEHRSQAMPSFYQPSHAGMIIPKLTFTCCTLSRRRTEMWIPIPSLWLQWYHHKIIIFQTFSELQLQKTSHLLPLKFSHKQTKFHIYNSNLYNRRSTLLTKHHPKFKTWSSFYTC